MCARTENLIAAATRESTVSARVHRRALPAARRIAVGRRHDERAVTTRPHDPLPAPRRDVHSPSVATSASTTAQTAAHDWNRVKAAEARRPTEAVGPREGAPVTAAAATVTAAAAATTAAAAAAPAADGAMPQSHRPLRQRAHPQEASKQFRPHPAYMAASTAAAAATAATSGGSTLPRHFRHRHPPPHLSEPPPPYLQ